MKQPDTKQSGTTQPDTNQRDTKERGAHDQYAAAFFIIGGCCIIAGGLVAAVTGPLALTSGSWVAAYLVLVCGVAQCAFGVAQRAFARHPLTPRTFWVELACWNVGSAAVITGTLVRQPIVVDIGGALLVVALVLLMRAVSPSPTPRRALLWIYRALIIVLLVSIPIGLTLATIRAT